VPSSESSNMPKNLDLSRNNLPKWGCKRKIKKVGFDQTEKGIQYIPKKTIID
jgi:hypothetical protein